MTEVMREEEEILDKKYMIETEEGILHSETDPEVAIIQGGHADSLVILPKHILRRTLL